MRLHLGSGMTGSGRSRSSSRRIKHKQQQANKIRTLAGSVDYTIAKLQKRKKKLLALAAKIEGELNGE